MKQSAKFVRERFESIVERLIAVASIPSPTFQERKKIRYLRSCLNSLNVERVKQDSLGNLEANITGLTSKTILLCAHVDTALNLEHNSIYRTGNKLYGHGVCDNTAGVVAILTMLEYIKLASITPQYDLKILFSVREEGLGSKQGIRKFLDNRNTQISAVINVESHDVGRITTGSIGQFRVFIKVITQKGGHSWRDFGNQNAVIVLAELIMSLNSFRELHIKGESSYNFSMIDGGDSINAIPRTASIYYEMRAIRRDKFLLLKKKFLDEVATLKKRYNSSKIEIDIIADSEPATIPQEHPLTRYIQKIHENIGIVSVLGYGNTDGDVPLELQIPTVTIGTSIGHNTHSKEEYLELSSISKGYTQVIEVISNLQSLKITW